MSMETDRIESDINESRHRLNDTLSALGHKLSPGQMLDEVLGLAQGQAGEFAGKLGRQVKDNPMPTLLIAAGVGMLLLNRGGVSSSGAQIDHEDWHAERRYRALEEARWSTPRETNESDDAWNERVHGAYARALDLKQAADEAMHDFKARVSRAVDAAKQAGESARLRVSRALSNTKAAAAHQVERLGQRAAAAKHGAEDFYEHTPLAAGAIALAVGALIGSATPLSRQEREALHDVADTALRKGADLAERGANAVADRVERGAEAAGDRIERAVH
ncbi:MAG: DUF3618 domain-containing protein [Caulobacterales bacterium]|jgi:ElaB/YqjD/DUF883 family membrane-anchored ribosome-binding protein|nr:DUF3618 domain-containing protein [Caulobacterales bacterium]